MEISTSTSILTQEINDVEFILKYHDRKEGYITIPNESGLANVKAQTEKVNKLLKNIPTDSITELSYIIYVGPKLVRDKIGITQEPEQKYKTSIGNEVRRTNEEITRISEHDGIRKPKKRQLIHT